MLLWYHFASSCVTLISYSLTSSPGYLASHHSCLIRVLFFTVFCNINHFWIPTFYIQNPQEKVYVNSTQVNVSSPQLFLWVLKRANSRNLLGLLASSLLNLSFVKCSEFHTIDKWVSKEVEVIRVKIKSIRSCIIIPVFANK